MLSFANFEPIEIFIKILVFSGAEIRPRFQWNLGDFLN